MDGLHSDAAMATPAENDLFSNTSFFIGAARDDPALSKDEMVVLVRKTATSSPTTVTSLIMPSATGSPCSCCGACLLDEDKLSRRTESTLSSSARRRTSRLRARLSVQFMGVVQPEGEPKWLTSQGWSNASDGTRTSGREVPLKCWKRLALFPNRRSYHSFTCADLASTLLFLRRYFHFSDVLEA